jgi:hypothetical protein
MEMAVSETGRHQAAMEVGDDSVGPDIAAHGGACSDCEEALTLDRECFRHRRAWIGGEDFAVEENRIRGRRVLRRARQRRCGEREAEERRDAPYSEEFSGGAPPPSIAGHLPSLSPRRAEV